MSNAQASDLPAELSGLVTDAALEASNLHAIHVRTWLAHGDRDRAVKAFEYADQFWRIAKAEMRRIRAERERK